MLPLLFGKNKGAVTVIIGSDAVSKADKPEYDRGSMKKIAAKELINAVKSADEAAVIAAFEAMMLLCEEEEKEG